MSTFNIDEFCLFIIYRFLDHVNILITMLRTWGDYCYRDDYCLMRRTQYDRLSQ